MSINLRLSRIKFFYVISLLAMYPPLVVAPLGSQSSTDCIHVCICCEGQVKELFFCVAASH